MHLFFGLGDGNFIAFFDEPRTAINEHFARKDSFDVHIALRRKAMRPCTLQARINASGKTCLGLWITILCSRCM